MFNILNTFRGILLVTGPLALIDIALILPPQILFTYIAATDIYNYNTLRPDLQLPSAYATSGYGVRANYWPFGVAISSLVVGVMLFLVLRGINGVPRVYKRRSAITLVVSVFLAVFSGIAGILISSARPFWSPNSSGDGIVNATHAQLANYCGVAAIGPDWKNQTIDWTTDSRVQDFLYCRSGSFNYVAPSSSPSMTPSVTPSASPSAAAAALAARALVRPNILVPTYSLHISRVSNEDSNYNDNNRAHYQHDDIPMHPQAARLYRRDDPPGPTTSPTVQSLIAPHDIEGLCTCADSTCIQFSCLEGIFSSNASGDPYIDSTVFAVNFDRCQTCASIELGADAWVPFTGSLLSGSFSAWVAGVVIQMICWLLIPLQVGLFMYVLGSLWKGVYDDIYEGGSFDRLEGGGGSSGGEEITAAPLKHPVTFTLIPLAVFAILMVGGQLLVTYIAAFFVLIFHVFVSLLGGLYIYELSLRYGRTRVADVFVGTCVFLCVLWIAYFMWQAGLDATNYQEGNAWGILFVPAMDVATQVIGWMTVAIEILFALWICRGILLEANVGLSFTNSSVDRAEQRRRQQEQADAELEMQREAARRPASNRRGNNNNNNNSGSRGGDLDRSANSLNSGGGDGRVKWWQAAL